MTPHINMRTPWKSIEDIKADYLLDVTEGPGDHHVNAFAALRAVHGYNWNQCRALVMDWMQEILDAKMAEVRHAAE